MFCAYGLWLRVYKIGFHFVRNTLSSYLLFICIVAILMSFECVTWLRKNQSLRNRNFCRFQCPREIVISGSNFEESMSSNCWLRPASWCVKLTPSHSCKHNALWQSFNGRCDIQNFELCLSPRLKEGMESESEIINQIFGHHASSKK